jgi:hypothetical protein
MFAFLGNLWRRWRLRDLDDGRSETERLEAVRAYADWVRHPPPAPERPARQAAEEPVPVVPPVRGMAPSPGRRRIGS